MRFNDLPTDRWAEEVQLDLHTACTLDTEADGIDESFDTADFLAVDDVIELLGEVA